MSVVNEQFVQSILEKIKHPKYNQSILSFGYVKKISIQGKRVSITLDFRGAPADIKKAVKSQIEAHLKQALPEHLVLLVEASPSLQVAGQKPGASSTDPWAGRAPIPGVKHVLAIASGKGGVGKSTVATNMALAFKQLGYQVGLMDSDIYGPSIQIMMGVTDRPRISSQQKLIPVEQYGIKMMSMGFLLDKEVPVIWRGPMVMKAVTQFLHDVAWGELDLLVIDLPPGTGDAQLTLVQRIPLSGAVIVTTPQEVAVVDARRGFHMFEKVHTRVFGIVENMAYFQCPKCGENYYIFGKGGGSRAAYELGVPFLGEIPIDPEVTEGGDRGEPILIRQPEGEIAQSFRQIAQKLLSAGLLAQ